MSEIDNNFGTGSLGGFPAPAWSTFTDPTLNTLSANDLPFPALGGVDPAELANILAWAAQGDNDADAVHQPNGTTQRDDGSLAVKKELEAAAEEAQRRTAVASIGIPLDPYSRVYLSMDNTIASLGDRKLMAELRGDKGAVVIIDSVITFLKNMKESMAENKKNAEIAEQKRQEENQAQAKRDDAKRAAQARAQQKVAAKIEAAENEHEKRVTTETFYTSTATRETGKDLYFNVQSVRDRDRLASQNETRAEDVRGKPRNV